MVERFHRQLKAAIKCHRSEKWVDVLPTVLLGIRAAFKENLQATAAEMVYGQQLRLPGDFLGAQSSDGDECSAPDFANELKSHMRELRPAHVNRHGERKPFIFKDLATAKHVFVRYDGVKKPLQNPYDGPFPVSERDTKTVTVIVRGREVKVSIERVKPAYILNDAESANDVMDVPSPETISVPEKCANTTTTAKCTTRSGRRVRFPDRLQVAYVS